MIKFRRIFDLTADLQRGRFADAKSLFAKAFPAEINVLERIELAFADPLGRTFEPLLIVAENQRGQVSGFAFAFYFPKLRFAYLQYIASDPVLAARGIGGATYEALRDVLANKNARGLFLDVPPNDPAKLKSNQDPETNRRRIDFYERFDARVIIDTLWDVEPNPRNENYLTLLVYDPLGHRGQLRGSDARRVVESILCTQYGYASTDAFVRRIVGSFRHETVTFRPIRRQPELAFPEKGMFLKPMSMVVAEGHEIHHLKEKGYRHLEKSPYPTGASRANQIQSCEVDLMGEMGDGADWIFRCRPAA